jgi:N-acetylglutamate synthase-like GNAT family acetyltransferase
LATVADRCQNSIDTQVYTSYTCTVKKQSLNNNSAILMLPRNVSVRNYLKPGDIGYLIYLHGALYAREYGWDHTLEAYVAVPLSRFAQSHTEREQIWIVEKEAMLAGAVAIVEASREEAQLRWLLLDPNLRGQGLGKILVAEAISFCKLHGYSTIFLWTVSSLPAAAHIYQSAGFQLTQENPPTPIWGALVSEQRYELRL